MEGKIKQINEEQQENKSKEGTKFEDEKLLLNISLCEMYLLKR